MKVTLSPRTPTHPSVDLVYRESDGFIATSGRPKWVRPLLAYLRGDRVKLLELDMLKHFDTTREPDPEGLMVSPAYTLRKIASSEDFVSALNDQRWEYLYDIEYDA